MSDSAKGEKIVLTPLRCVRTDFQGAAGKRKSLSFAALSFGLCFYSERKCKHFALY